MPGRPASAAVGRVPRDQGHLTEPVHWQGRQWAVTGYGIEALDGMYHVPFIDIPNAEDGRPAWLNDLCRRYGTDGDDLAAALRVARTLRPAGGHAVEVGGMSAQSVSAGGLFCGNGPISEALVPVVLRGRPRRVRPELCC